MHFNRQWPNKCDITLASGNVWNSGWNWLDIFNLGVITLAVVVGWGGGEVMGQFAFPSGLNDLQHIWISYQDQITATGGSVRWSRAHKNLQPFGLRRRNSDVTGVCLLGGTAVAPLQFPMLTIQTKSIRSSEAPGEPWSWVARREA